MDIHWANVLPRHAGCHLARTSYRPGMGVSLHGHDFAEVCWIEEGRIRHETPEAVTYLEAGDVVLIRPGHRHGLRGVGRIVNIAIAATLLEDLEQRYGDAPAWPWRAGPQPATARLDAADLVELARRLDGFRSGPADALARDTFLVDLLARMRPRTTWLWRGAPAWLAAALDRLAEPPHLAEGLPALVRLTGRSREHVSRVIHATTGRRAIDVLAELRLRWAERRLAISHEAVGDIAHACGFAGRARFHRLFRARTGLTPLAYRRACVGTVER